MRDKKMFVLKIVWRKSIASLYRLTQDVHTQRANLRSTAGDPTWVIFGKLWVSILLQFILKQSLKELNCRYCKLVEGSQIKYCVILITDNGTQPQMLPQLRGQIVHVVKINNHSKHIANAIRSTREKYRSFEGTRVHSMLSGI